MQHSRAGSPKSMQPRQVSIAQSALIGIAGNAPSYSIAISTGALLSAATGLAPALIFYCGFVVLGILLAYRRLNQEQTSAGAAYTWVSQILHPTLGFFAGWCLLVASLLFIVSASLPAGKAVVMTIDPAFGENKVLVTAVAMGLLIAVSVAVVRGMEVVGRLQSILTGLELALIGVIAIALMWNFGSEIFTARTLDGFLLRNLDLKTFADGIVIAIFLYWGWDVIFNIAEETRDGHRNTGRAGLIVLIALIVIFTFYATAAVSLITEEEIKASGDNAIFAIAAKVFPQPFDTIAIATFFLSTIGAMEASLLQFSRTVLAKARDGRMSARLGNLHTEWQTPVVAIVLDVVIVAVLLIGSLFVTGVEEAIQAGITATGILVAYYYGFAGIACAVYFMRKKNLGLVDRLLYVVWPILSVLVLVLAAVLSTLQFSKLAAGTVVFSLALGVIVYYLNRPKSAVRT
jgi:amino acid transporter